MSTIPNELRDEIVRKLEGAIAARDAQLHQLTADATRLLSLVGGLEADLARLNSLSDGMKRELTTAAAALDEERRRSAARLEELHHRSERQRAELTNAIEAARRAHRAEWDRLMQEVEAITATREERERRLRAASVRVVAEAAALLGDLCEPDVDAMDLQADLLSARQRLADAEVTVRDDTGPGAEAIAAARSVHDAALTLRRRLDVRRDTLESLRRSYDEDGRWLNDLLAGRTVAHALADQQEQVGLLLPVERDLLSGIVDRHVRRSSGTLTRWNGFAAVAARIDGVRDRIADEALRARQALPEAIAHEEKRYSLEWMWRDLELRFGSIRQEGDQTPGHWSDPADRKSTYRYLLWSPEGDVAVDVSWSGDVEVHLGRRREMNRTSPSPPSGGAQWIGDLRRRWTEMAARMDNPSWSPDLA